MKRLIDEKIKQKVIRRESKKKDTMKEKIDNNEFRKKDRQKGRYRDKKE